MTAEEFKVKMIAIGKNGDEEIRHVDADDLMCELLRSLGYGEGIEIFEDMPKWYA